MVGLRIGGVVVVVVAGVVVVSVAMIVAMPVVMVMMVMAAAVFVVMMTVVVVVMVVVAAHAILPGVSQEGRADRRERKRGAWRLAAPWCRVPARPRIGSGVVRDDG